VDQAAERPLERDLDLGAVDPPRRLVVATGDAQEKIARRREPAGERQVDERAERMTEPAARELSPIAQRLQRHVLSLVETVEHAAL